MLDSIDLELLTKEIRSDHKATRRAWRMLLIFLTICLVICILLVGLLFYGETIPSKTQARSCACVLTLITLEALVVLILGFAGTLVVFYANWKRRQKRANVIRLGAPSLQLPPSISSHVNRVINIWYIAIVVIAFILKFRFIDGFVFVVELWMIPFLVLSLIGIWVRRPLYHTNYEETIRRAQVCERWLKGNSAMLLAESLALIFAGKTGESERLHLQLIAQTRKDKALDWVAYLNYSIELTYQGRYAEALPLLEFAIRLQPQIPDGYKTLANWYLFQNSSPERALELAKFTTSLRSTVIGGVKENFKSLRLATEGWAEARTGQQLSAKFSLSEAFQIASPQYTPMFAELNRIAGETYVSLGDTTSAREDFQKAAEIDPNGRIGKLAQAALERLSSTN